MLLLSGLALAQVDTHPVPLDSWTRAANLIVEGTPDCSTRLVPADTGEERSLPSTVTCVFRAEALETLLGEPRTLTFHQDPGGVLSFKRARDPLDMGVQFQRGEHYMLWLAVSGDEVKLAADHSLVRRGTGRRTLAVHDELLGPLRIRTDGAVEALDVLSFAGDAFREARTPKERKRVAKELERVIDAESRTAMTWTELQSRVRKTLEE